MQHTKDTLLLSTERAQWNEQLFPSYIVFFLMAWVNFQERQRHRTFFMCNSRVQILTSEKHLVHRRSFEDSRGPAVPLADLYSQYFLQKHKLPSRLAASPLFKSTHRFIMQTDPTETSSPVITWRADSAALTFLLRPAGNMKSEDPWVLNFALEIC